MVNYYKILEVEPGASLDEITQSYRRLIQRYHPDRSSDPNATEISKQVNVAFDALKEQFELDPNWEEDFLQRHPPVDEPVVEPEHKMSSVAKIILSIIRIFYSPIFWVVTSGLLFIGLWIWLGNIVLWLVVLFGLFKWFSKG